MGDATARKAESAAPSSAIARCGMLFYPGSSQPLCRAKLAKQMVRSGWLILRGGKYERRQKDSEPPNPNSIWRTVARNRLAPVRVKHAPCSPGGDGRKTPAVLGLLFSSYQLTPENRSLYPHNRRSVAMAHGADTSGVIASANACCGRKKPRRGWSPGQGRTMPIMHRQRDYDMLLDRSRGVVSPRLRAPLR
jgi:hypothetical protein